MPLRSDASKRVRQGLNDERNPQWIHVAVDQLIPFLAVPAIQGLIFAHNANDHRTVRRLRNPLRKVFGVRRADR